MVSLNMPEGVRMRFPWASSSRQKQRKPLLHVPFIGRESLLEALDEHLQAARKGTPQYVILEGPAGSGKSALLTAFTSLSCRSTQLLVVRLNASDYVLPQECYGWLFDTLQRRAQEILQRLYNDSKRLRKALVVDWDETGFGNFLASVDWAEFPAGEAAHTQLPPSHGDALRRLFTLVRDHPWGVGAATMLGLTTRDPAGSMPPDGWRQRWMALLRALQTQGLAPGAALVILIDQLDASWLRHHADGQTWDHFWRTFVIATEDAGLPLLLIWSGTADGLQPVREAFTGRVGLTVHRVEGLAADEHRELLQQLQRALSRDYRTPWQQLLTGAEEGLRQPGRLVLATTCAAALAETPEGSEAGLAALVQAEVPTLIDRLVQMSHRRQPVNEASLRQFLEVCAFLPPGKEYTIEELLPLCNLEALDLDPVAGYTALATLLGQYGRYGLVHYDTYTTRYTTGNSQIQETLRRLLYPDEAERQEVMWWRHLAVTLMRHLQRGERAMLAALSPVFHPEEATVERLAPYLLPAFRHLVRTMTKAERQDVAGALEALPLPLAIELLQILLADEEDQVRSRAVQGVANLQDPATFPVLRDALRDTNSDVRWIAAHAVSQITGANTVDALIPLLTDEDKEVGRIAAEGLGQNGDRRAVPHLIAAMRDNYPLLRESAAQALGQLADKRALPALQEVLKDTSQPVRRSAEEALARLSTSS